MGLVTTTNRAGDGRSWTNDPKERTMTKTAPKTWLLWGRKANTAGGRRIKITAGPRSHCNAKRRARRAEGWTDLTVEPSPE